MKILNPEFLILIPLILIFTNKKNIFYSISAIFLVLGLSNISKKEIKKVKVDNKDIFIVVDTTYSMMCNDLKPNRLEYAKKELIKFIKRIDNPIGLISFDKNVNVITLPTLDKEYLISQIKNLKATKSRTDIKMAINSAKNLSSFKSIIILVSDGGEKKIKDNFIFWGFATKKGAKVPGFDGISKLNIIGEKYFKYNETDKLINYIKKTKKEKEKEVVIFKPINFIFVVLAFISFSIGVIFSRVKIFFLLVLIFPYQLKANDFLGCFLEYIGLRGDAINIFKKDNSDFAKMKLAIYYLENNKLHKALQEIEKVKNPKKRYIKALILTKLKKYNEAYKLLENSPLNKEEVKLYEKLKPFANRESSTIFQINSSNKNKKKDNYKNTKTTIQKEHLW